MAQTNQEQLDKDDAEFAAEFDAPETNKAEQTEDEAFGLAPDKVAAAEETAAEPPPAAAAETADPAAAEKQAELDAQAAAAETSNVDETQTTTEADGESAGGAGEQDDPGEALANDFGPEFVALLGRFIEMKCQEHLGSGLNGVQSTVDSIIADLERRDQQAHFKAIQSAHEDFQEVVASPDFEAYRATQAPAEQSDIDRVVASGSAQEIIDMLNKFKQSNTTGSADGGFDDEAAMDAAEGIRSGGGLRLPEKEPAGGSYEDAWNEK